MNAKDLFSVGIKIIGLLSFIRGVGDLMYIFVKSINDNSVLNNASSGAFPTLVYGFFYFAAGLYFIRGAQALVNFAFPQTEFEEGISGAQTPDASNQDTSDFD